MMDVAVTVPLISFVTSKPEAGFAFTEYLIIVPRKGGLNEMSIVESVIVLVFTYKFLGGGNNVL